jgi:plasmid maintenance system antidote protein VapI
MHQILEIQETVISETIDIVHDMILFNKQMEIYEITEVIGVSTKQIHFILHNKLNIKKTFRIYSI